MKLILLAALFYIINPALFAQKNPCNTDVAAFDYKKELSDTTIILKNGTELTFNRCEFFDIKDCVEFAEIKALNDLKAYGLSTMDDKGNLLLSCGMFFLNLEAGDCTKKCLEVPVRIRIPKMESSCYVENDRNNLYFANSSGNWALKNEPTKEFTDKNQQNYFEFFAKCSGKYNCDQKMRTTIVKFKWRNMQNIKFLNLTSNCPLINATFYSGRRKNIVFAKIPNVNPDSLLIKAEGNNSIENVSISKPLSSLKTSYRKSAFTTISQRTMRKVLFFFKFKERRVYRKYLLN